MATTRFVILPGSQRQPLANSRPVGHADPSEITNITVRLRPVNDIAALTATVEKLYARPLAKRIYLTREELTHRHGARREDLDAVEHFAQRHNLTVSHRSAAQRSLTLTGALADIIRAFPAKLRMFDHSTGSYRGRTGAISIPPEFRGIITGVFGPTSKPPTVRALQPRLPLSPPLPSRNATTFPNSTARDNASASSNSAAPSRTAISPRTSGKSASRPPTSPPFPYTTAAAASRNSPTEK